jgi:hypothetical protein
MWTLEKKQKYNREYRIRNKIILNKKRKEWTLKRRIAIIKKFGGKCKRCGFDDPRALQIDHVNNGGHKEYKKMSEFRYYKMVLEDTSGKYQILCANCNWIKRYEKS